MFHAAIPEILNITWQQLLCYHGPGLMVSIHSKKVIRLAFIQNNRSNFRHKLVTKDITNFRYKLVTKDITNYVYSESHFLALLISFPYINTHWWYIYVCIAYQMSWCISIKGPKLLLVCDFSFCGILSLNGPLVFESVVTVVTV